MGLIYLDTCLVIYLTEQAPGRSDRLLAAMAGASVAFATSPLVRMECLVGPLRAGNKPLENEYRRVLASFHALGIDEAQFDAAADLRARHRLKPIDALHLACAAHHRCSALWTNDNRFSDAGGGMVHALSL